MPGILFANHSLKEDSWQILQHEPYLSFESCDVEGCYAGRVSNNIFNTGQPARSDRFQVLIDGEFSNRQEMWGSLQRSGGTLPDDDHGLILALLQQGHGLETILKAADGGFFITVVDREHHCVQFGNDRYGLRPHYYCSKGDRFILAPQVKFCLGLSWVSDTLDMQSVAEYFNFQLILGDRTFFSDVLLFPSGSVGQFDLGDSTLSLKKYWQPEDWIGETFGGTFEEAAEETTAIFKKVVADMTADNRRYGLYLSGGLDSRQILGAIPDNVGPIHTYTFGQPGCRDHVYAEQMAKIAGTHHHEVLFENGEWLYDIAEAHTSLTEGFHCLWHAHNFKDVLQVREHCDINLSGHFGDVLIGGSVLKDCPPGFVFRNRLRNTYVEYYGLTYPHRGDFHDAWALLKPSEADLFQSLNRYPESHHGLHPSVIADFMALEYRARKMIQYYLVHNRPYFEARTPFLNARLLKLVYSFPPAYREDRRLQIAILDNLDKRLSAVPWDVTNIPPTGRKGLRTWHKNIVFADRVLKKFSGREWLTPKVRRYHDYQNWIVHDLREWVSTVLLGADAVVPGLFKEGYVESVIRDHMDGSGRSYSSTFKIGTMLSLELMIQQVKKVQKIE